jgi:hypothetical protein
VKPTGAAVGAPSGIAGATFIGAATARAGANAKARRPRADRLRMDIHPLFGIEYRN